MKRHAPSLSARPTHWIQVAVILVLGTPAPFPPLAAHAQEPFEGETLISSSLTNETRLIDLDGFTLRSWHGADLPASTAYLLEDGSILRPCRDPAGAFTASGYGGRIQRIDADDHVAWDYFFSTPDHQQHHDIAPMPGGNVLLIAWERKTREEALAAGRVSVSGNMWPAMIAEVEPAGPAGGVIAWEWHAWDHLVQDADSTRANYGVVSDHPELIDINHGEIAASGDWTHENAIDYDPLRDEIVISSRTMGEIYVIDHSTTTGEAAGHGGGQRGRGGDILYRWGNPQAYDRGTAADQQLFVQHGANWIDPGLPGQGRILIFNNGDRPGMENDYSTVVELAPPRDNAGNYVIDAGIPFGPATPDWTYGGPGFYGGPIQCGAFRLPNGNTLIGLYARAELVEVTATGATVWHYLHPPGRFARAPRYWDAATRVAEGSAAGGAGAAAGTSTELSLTCSPNPLPESARLDFRVPRDERIDISVFAITGRRVVTLLEGRPGAGSSCVTWDGRDDRGGTLPPGVYFARMIAGTSSLTTKLVLE